jgi:hypothetical protein
MSHTGIDSQYPAFIAKRCVTEPEGFAAFAIVWIVDNVLIVRTLPDAGRDCRVDSPLSDVPGYKNA